MKKILQVIASLVYSTIATSILMTIAFIPFLILDKVGFWWGLAILLLLGGFVQALQGTITMLVIAPYVWIVQNNKVAKWIAYIICTAMSIEYIVYLWINTPHSLGMIVFAIILSLLVINAAKTLILTLIGIE